MSMDTKALDATYVANTYKRFPVALERGKGCTLYDESDKKYIDLSGGIAVNSFGVNDEPFISAVTAQLHRVQHTSNLYYTAPQAKLAQLLCEKTGMKKVFFGNSGAEANECAIKAGRKYASDHFGEGIRDTIITLNGSFHGRTITTLSATGQTDMHRHFGPFTPGFVHVDPDDIGQMKEAMKGHSVAAVMLELVQGEGGVRPLDPDYVKAVADLCKQNDSLLIIDEVQTGVGRTGALFCFELYGIQPDIVTTAKGLGGGLPIGACLLSEKLAETLSPGTHGSTFGGNPVCAAGALSIIERIDEELLKDVRRKHDTILSALSSLPLVKKITGLGLMLGIEVSVPALEIVNKLMERGVLVITAKDKVRLLPALNISDEELSAALSVMKEVLS